MRAKIAAEAEAGAVKSDHREQNGGEENAMNEEEAVASGSGFGDATANGSGSRSGQEGVGKIVDEATGKSWECNIGFERKGKPGVMDIEVSRCT